MYFLFQSLERGFDFEDQRCHFVPVQLKRIGVAENVPEIEILFEYIPQRCRNEGWSLRRSNRHTIQQHRMPQFTVRRTAIDCRAHPFQNVFDGRVERMLCRRQSIDLDLRGRFAGPTFFD